MTILLFAALILYFIATALQFTGVAVRKGQGPLCPAARAALIAAFVLHTAYTVWRGIAAGRLPLSNQFEFASGFAWAAALMGFLLYLRLRSQPVLTVTMPAAFLILSYAALQPQDIRELMPALRSAWFAIHIGSAAFSYAAFAIAGGLGIAYLVRLRKAGGTDEKPPEEDPRLRQLDSLGYRMICLGFLLLTVVIFSGAIWAEQAWSSWWSWDPKETWALITWIFYAIYLHQRLRLKWHGKRTAILAIVALALVLFTFAGVNLLLPGLHSYK